MICVFVSKIPRASKTPKAKPKYRRAKPKHNGLDGKGMLYANKLSRNKHGTGDADLLVVTPLKKEPIMDAIRELEGKPICLSINI